MSIPGETISWPGYVPVQYLVTLRIKNSTACKSSSTTVQPIGTILYAETGFYGSPSGDDDDDHFYGAYGDDDTIMDENFLPGGVCFPLGNNNNKGSIIYYYIPTCNLNIGTINVTAYNCKYQFYDSNSQTCANVKTGTQVFGSGKTCFVEYRSKEVIFTTISTFPSLLWGNAKGVTTQLYNSNKCSNNILAYSWQSSSCIYEGGYSDDNDDAGYSTNKLCTSEGIVLDKYYGSGCNSKSLLFEKIRERNSYIANEESDVYSCALHSKQNNITVSPTVGSFNIGSFYQSVDCKHKHVVSLTTAICLTFFIPLIFYILCWVIIVKVMKRGDLCAKALCLEGNKKKVDLASQDSLTLNKL